VDNCEHELAGISEKLTLHLLASQSFCTTIVMG
jgi:hypothetical protein